MRVRAGRCGGVRRLRLCVGLATATTLFALCGLCACQPAADDTSQGRPGASVPTFGYDALRSGAVPSSLTAERYPGLSVRDVTGLEGAVIKGSPLYLNGDQDEIPGFDGHGLVVGAKGYLLLIDPYTEKVRWQVELPLQGFPATPVVDLKRGKLYFTSRKHDPVRIGGNTIRRTRLGLYAVGLDGSGLHGFEIDLDALVPGDPGDELLPSHYLRCHTALGLSPEPGRHGIFFGCSLKASELPGTKDYLRSRSARGVLVFVDLDEAGNLSGPETVHAFAPTPPRDDPRTGYDAGIWHAGGGPAVLPDGSILLATGNGSFVPEQENFGCSVVRVDPITLTARAGSSRGAAFYSLDSAGHSECHGTNSDLSSSSVASVAIPGRFPALRGRRIISAITGKDGVLRVFDPDRLPGDDARGRHEVEFAGRLFGQPLVLRDSGQVRIFAGGDLKPSPDRRRRRDLVLASAGNGEYLEAQGYRRGACLGLLRSTPGPGTVELDLYYSGVVRGDHVLVPSGSRLAARLAAGELEYDGEIEALGADHLPGVPPYRKALSGKAPRGKGKAPSAGYGWSDPAAPLAEGLAMSRLDYHASALGGLFAMPASVPLEDLGEFEARPLSAMAALGDDPVYVAVPREPGACQDPPPGYTTLHPFRRPRRPSAPEGWVMSSFLVEPDLTPVEQWRVERSDGTAFPHAHAALTRGPEGEPGVILFPVFGANGEPSRLVVLDSRDGSLMDEVPFEGFVHFSMPLIVDDRVFLATGQGLKVFCPESRPGARPCGPSAGGGG